VAVLSTATRLTVVMGNRDVRPVMTDTGGERRPAVVDHAPQNPRFSFTVFSSRDSMCSKISRPAIR
jgi:hypothetical protein